MTNGVFHYQPNSSTQAIDVVIHNAVARAKANSDVTFDARASVNDKALTIGLQSIWPTPTNTFRQVPLTLDLLGDNERVTLDGFTRIPFDKTRYRLGLDMQGQSLSELTPQGVPTLPDLGPYAFRATFDAYPEGYVLSNILVTVGTTTLQGHAGVFATSNVSTRIVVDLHSDRIQLDDLLVEQWFKTNSPAGTAETTANSEKPSLTNQIDSVAGYILEQLEADVHLQVDSVRSGEDILGAGELGLRVHDGKLQLSPFWVELPGGRLTAALDYREHTDAASLDLSVTTEMFDYGILARRIDPETQTSGAITLDLHVSAEGPRGRQLLDHADGHLGAALFPSNLDASVFDLWSANLITSLIPSLDRSESKVNCIALVLNLTDGVLTDRDIVIDTTKVRVLGTARIDLADNSLNISVRPRSKKPRFFTLQTPVSVSGNVDDPQIEVSGWQIAKSAVGFVASVVTVPLRWPFVTPIPEDGSKECLQRMQMAVDEIQATKTPTE